MKVARFLEHWSITENPFRAEEARHDTVFQRMGAQDTTHPDFEKILGQLDKPSTSIVFGEKGSGKTAIRMQIGERIAEHNRTSDEGRLLLVAYDDLNSALDAFCATAGRKAGEDPLGVMKSFRLVDHMDAILQRAVTKVVDGLLRDSRAESGLLPVDALKRIRAADATITRDMLLLQALYDRPDEAPARGLRLRRALRVRAFGGRLLWDALAGLGWIPSVAVYLYDWIVGFDGGPPDFGLWFAYLLGAIWLLALLKWLLLDFAGSGLRMRRLSRRVAGQLRTLGRSASSIASSLRLLRGGERSASVLPVDDSDEPRYAMFDRLNRILGLLGFRGVLVIVDRMDEPTLISGDPDRMRAIVWPLLNNKFLQLEGFGFKLLLPIELRHLLFRESSVFFQEARLDKQSLIEQLGWTGATLYDLCNARLEACRSQGAAPMSLIDLFDEDVTQRDLVDALDQMRQPRDAFKMLYQCIQEHCQIVTDDAEQWRIPRLVLETVRRQQSERVEQLFRGMRPA